MAACTCQRETRCQGYKCKSWATQACSQDTRSRIPDHPKRAVPGSAASAQSTIRRAGNRSLAYSLQPNDYRLLRQGVAGVCLDMWKKLPRMRRCTWTLGPSAYIRHGPHGRCPQAGAAAAGCCKVNKVLVQWGREAWDGGGRGGRGGVGTERNVLSRFLLHCISLLCSWTVDTTREHTRQNRARTGEMWQWHLP